MTEPELQATFKTFSYEERKENLQLIDGVPVRPQVACDDMATYQLEDCLSCPQRRECEPEEQP
jgi:hypothetical protein